MATVVKTRLLNRVEGFVVSERDTDARVRALYDKRIVPVGDSITWGFPDGGYRRTFSALMTSDAIPFGYFGNVVDIFAPSEGHNGAGVQTILDLIPSWTYQAPTDVLFLLGTNELPGDGTGADIAARLASVVTALHAHWPARIWWGTMLDNTNYHPIPDRVNSFLPGYATQLRDQGIDLRLVDTRQALDMFSSDSNDGKHPSPSGYVKLGNFWFDAFTSCQHVLVP